MRHETSLCYVESTNKNWNGFMWYGPSMSKI